MNRKLTHGKGWTFGTLLFHGIACLTGETVVAEQVARAGLTDYKTGRYERAAQTLKTCALDGEPRCQLALGTMYQKGLGVTRDEYAAFNWTRRAAELGFAPAQLNLGYMYLEGEGVTDNKDLAFKWFKRAAEQGNQHAQFIYDYLLNPESEEYGC